MSNRERKRRHKELVKLLDRLCATRDRHCPKYRRKQKDRMWRLAMSLRYGARASVDRGLSPYGVVTEHRVTE